MMFKIVGMKNFINIQLNVLYLMERWEEQKIRRKLLKYLAHAVMNTNTCIRYRTGLQSPLLAPAWLADRISALVTAGSNLPNKRAFRLIMGR